jgi:hypothetical protein
MIRPRACSTGYQEVRNERGQYHNENGPAVIWPNGDMEYRHNGQFHRSDGPAIIWSTGYQVFYQWGRVHRIDGPARIYPDGTHEYWVEDEIPIMFNDMVITDGPIPFYAERVPEVRYRNNESMYAYRITDPDELALAQLYYS